MSSPNKITILRIILAFVFMSLILAQGIVYKIFALIVFTIACLSDFYDGRIARSMKLESDFGRLMDPIADKILLLSAFLVFVELKIIPAWMVVIIISRELLITGLRLFALSKRRVLVSSRGGKHKTVSQMVTIFVILIFLVLKEIAQKLSFWNPKINSVSQDAIFVLMVLTTILTLTSGVSYLWQNRSLLLEHER